ncbi:hypothetical protein QJ054_33940 [Streptomyces sp. AN-3]|uniref:hypothetical protein n=1 Tax=Streptomyces sp. AN-3 TaxID=3044177 RepID=UPI00249C9883|nr:hypothetical protein [Streptomyces sp. AN-3]MDI3102040.1 hypothetical protein [Streptomyces sp. AN-3]MDV6291276.1 hypothetical protein [Streptomyces sp. UP1A-1]
MIEKQPPALAHELRALTTAPALSRGPQCSVGAFLDAADLNDAAALREVLDNDRIPARAIADTLSRHGETITAYTVARHRRRGESNGCRCER